MASYYYAAASLPTLRFDGERAPGRDEFLDLCRQWATESDFSHISSAELEPPEDLTGVHPLLVRYYRWETGLRNELVRQRAAVLSRDGAGQIRRGRDGDDYSARTGLSDAVRAALQAGTPLQADAILDELRWQYLGELEVGQFFNLEYMMLYFLRLQIVLRRLGLEKDRGRQQLDDHYAVVRGRMQESQKSNGVQA